MLVFVERCMETELNNNIFYGPQKQLITNKVGIHFYKNKLEKLRSENLWFAYEKGISHAQLKTQTW